MSFTQPLCFDCWDKRHPDRLSHPHHRRGGGPGETEQCCDCGQSTRSGIYFRADPKTVSYPRSEEEE